MKNAIAYITRAAAVEQKEGGVRSVYDFYASVEKLAKAEKAKAEKLAIATGEAKKVVNGTQDRAPNKDKYIELHGVVNWTKNCTTTTRSITVWLSDYING